jgi:hypothetical protein
MDVMVTLNFQRKLEKLNINFTCPDVSGEDLEAIISMAY